MYQKTKPADPPDNSASITYGRKETVARIREKKLMRKFSREICAGAPSAARTSATSPAFKPTVNHPRNKPNPMQVRRLSGPSLRNKKYVGIPSTSAHR